MGEQLAQEGLVARADQIVDQPIARLRRVPFATVHAAIEENGVLGSAVFDVRVLRDQHGCLEGAA
jgi:hypothetical protein